MIIVNSALMQNEIIEILENIKEPKYKFIKKNGIRLYFETSIEDLDEASKIAKASIKEKPEAAALFFSVVPA